MKITESGKNLLWFIRFINYLTDQTQFIKYNNSNTSFRKILCDFSQGSALKPLLFLIYVNDVKDASKNLDLTMLNVSGLKPMNYQLTLRKLSLHYFMKNF